jgi:hypothetical protein
MEHYKTITVPPEPEKTKEVFDHYTCDICGLKTKSKENWGRGSNYHIDKPTIKYNIGDGFPEGGSGEEYYLDICPTCFTEKIHPLLKEKFGIEFNIREWSF